MIDRSAATPLYYQLRENLRRRILAQEWKDGEALPPEMGLCEAHSVSRSVVRQAIGDLVHEGLLERRQGFGTFVAQPKIKEALAAQEVGFFDDMTNSGYTVTTVVLRQAIERPSPEVAADLALAPGERVVVLSRLRAVDGVPLVYVESRLSASRFAGLLAEDLRTQSLYGVLRTRYDIRVGGSRRLIGAVAASRRIARLLEIEPRSPLVVLDSVSYAEGQGDPIETYLAYHRGDRTKFEVHTRADGVTLSNLRLVEGE